MTNIANSDWSSEDIQARQLAVEEVRREFSDHVRELYEGNLVDELLSGMMRKPPKDIVGYVVEMLLNESSIYRSLALSFLFGRGAFSGYVPDLISLARKISCSNESLLNTGVVERTMINRLLSMAGDAANPSDFDVIVEAINDDHLGDGRILLLSPLQRSRSKRAKSEIARLADIPPFSLELRN